MASSFRADFKFCGFFSGKDISAAKWLKKLDWELEGYSIDGIIPPHRYTQALDLLLTEDAAAWAESHPQAVSILASANPTQESVKNFRNLLCERFPTKSSEVSTISFDTELSELKQHNESLSAYYKRLLAMMQRVGARDRPTQVSESSPMLSMLEEAMLESVMKAFLRGLADPDVRREATRAVAAPDRSLRGAYTLAEEARRTKAEIQKLNDEEYKTKENELLRSIVQKTMSKSQLDNLVSSYQANAGAMTSSAQYNIDSLGKLLEKLGQSQNQANNGTRPSNNDSNHHHSDRYEPPPQPRQHIAQNPNRLNGSGPDNRDSVLRKPTAPLRGNPRQIQDRSKSENPFINGSKPYNIKDDGPLCVRGGCYNSRKDDGHECRPLPAWEQAYLREIVFGTPPQVSFASAGFGDYDGNVTPWTYPRDPVKPFTESSSSSSSRSGVWTPSSESSASRANSVTFGVAKSLVSPLGESNAAAANYGESSGPNKRPHEDESQSQTVQNDPSQPQSQPQNQPQNVTQAADDRPKVKGKKRVGKKIELQPIVGMFNDSLGKYDSPMSIRQMLQRTKVDMSWMDLVAWSPAIGRELKRLCTRVAKKREKKLAKQPVQLPQAPPFPFGTFNPNMAQQFQQMPTAVPTQGPVPQTFQPQAFMPQPAVMVQQPQQFQQPQQPQTGMGAGSSAIKARVDAIEAQPDGHTKFLSTMVGAEKAFRIPGTVRAGRVETKLDKREIQADQGSDMNVMSPPMVRKLKLTPRPLSDIGFKGLTMQTADHHESLLESYVGFDLCVEGIWRAIRCFVSPTVRGVTEEPRLLLGLPWLYSVNAIISVRQSSIQIGDPSIGERVRYVTGPELVYHKDHSMLMYPKAIIRADEAFINSLDSDSDESSDESEDDLSDIDEADF